MGVVIGTVRASGTHVSLPPKRSTRLVPLNIPVLAMQRSPGRRTCSALAHPFHLQLYLMQDLLHLTLLLKQTLLQNSLLARTFPIGRRSTAGLRAEDALLSFWPVIMKGVVIGIVRASGTHVSLPPKISIRPAPLSIPVLVGQGSSGHLTCSARALTMLHQRPLACRASRLEACHGWSWGESFQG